MSAKQFVDTNILVYAYDSQAGKKHDIARNLINKIWEEKNGVISTQVLCEFCSVLQKKTKLKPLQSLEIIKPYFEWKVVNTESELIAEGLRIQARYKFSFWDSFIIAAAAKVKATILYSEDLQHGQKIKGLTITNPFAK